MRKIKKNLFIILIILIAIIFCVSYMLQHKNSQKFDSSIKTDKNQNTKITLVISVATSLKDAVNELKSEYMLTNPNVNLLINFGGSGTLQQQIEQGAPVDVFISAGQSQMNALDQKKLLLDGTKKILLSNNMVLILPKNSKITSIYDLKSDIVKKIAVGEIKTVPAGQYASQILEYYKLTSLIKDKLIYGQDVRTVLSWVETGDADAGFVYKTDALIADKSTTTLDIDKNSHKPIVYPVAIINDTKNKDIALDFEKFLSTDKAIKIFEKYGFEIAN